MEFYSFQSWVHPLFVIPEGAFCGTEYLYILRTRQVLGLYCFVPVIHVKL